MGDDGTRPASGQESLLTVAVAAGINLAIAVAKVAANGAAGSVAVGRPLVAMIAVATPAGQVLQGGSGGVPVAAPAGGLPAGFGAQQPLRVELMAPVGRHGRPPSAVAWLVDALASAAAPELPIGPVGRLGGEPGGRWRRPPVPSHSAQAMLRRP